MPLPAPATGAEARALLAFAASFLWVDLQVAPIDRAFLLGLAVELGVSPDDVQGLVARPPRPEEVDPTRVPPPLAAAVRQVALRAIAADGRVHQDEMTMFDLLDELLPADAPPDAPVANA
jgi:hypothetical protein